MSQNALIVLGLLFGGGTLVGLFKVIANSDVGQAIADAIRHNSGANEGAAVRRELDEMRGSLEQLQGEVGALESQLAEAHERLEFAERLLAQAREPAQLPHGAHQ
jgi:multidrug resistance efflux pump